MGTQTIKSRIASRSLLAHAAVAPTVRGEHAGATVFFARWDSFIDLRYLATRPSASRVAVCHRFGRYTGGRELGRVPDRILPRRARVPSGTAGIGRAKLAAVLQSLHGTKR